MIKSFLAFILQIGFLATLTGQSLYYTVKFPDDYTVYGCGAPPGITYPYIVKYGNCSFNVGVSYKDQIFYTNSTGGCYKILRTWKLLYWCDYDPNWPSPYFIMNPTNSDVGPTVNANSSNHGYLQYTQIIKVIDTQAPYYLDCPTDAVVFCDYTNNDPSQYKNGPDDKCEGPVNLKVKVKDACSGTDVDLTYRLFLDLDGNGSMETYISSSAANAWPIETTIQGDTVCGQIKFPAGHGFPYGKHKIEWIANDNCGNEALCKYEFIVKDCKHPTITCYNGLSINMMPGGMITLWDTDFIKEYYDNCTPKSQIKIAIRKAGTGTGFPTGNHSVTFNCDELGEQPVEVWAQDAYGNASYCATFVDVQDNIGTCPPNNKFAGSVATDAKIPVPGTTLSLTKSNQTVESVVTNDLGQYEIGSHAAGCNYKLVPVLDGPVQAGINTLDALLVAGQLDNVQPLPSPYKLIAADVDKSGTLTSTDLNNIVNVALGVQNAFPGNTAWQFVPQSHVFADPLNPWSVAIPPSLIFCMSGDIKFDPDFVAIKTGDVDGSADPSNLVSSSIDDRSADGQVMFQTRDQMFTSGQEVRVEVVSPELANLAAFQFTLGFDPAFLTLKEVDPNLVPANYIGRPDDTHVTASWHSSIMLDPSIQVKNLRVRTFTLVFTALQKGVLSEVLHMNSNITAAEAYTRGLQTLPAGLEFLPESAGKSSPSFLSVRPNPVTDRFTTAYYLPEAGPTTFTLTDATGRVLQSVQADRERGYHETQFDVSGAKPGLLFLRLEAGEGADIQKVLKY